jgi:hypothetical protein
MPVATTTVGALVLTVAIGAIVSFAFRTKVDPREPPAVYSTIPFIGHIIGMLREGPLYIARIR